MSQMGKTEQHHQITQSWANSLKTDGDGLIREHGRIESQMESLKSELTTPYISVSGFIGFFLSFNLPEPV